MKKIYALFAIAVLTLVVLLFITNPGLLDKVWLWVIGFIGYVLILIEKGYKAVTNAFKKSDDAEKSISGKSISSYFTLDHDKKAEVERIEEKIHKIEKQLQNGADNQPWLSGQYLTVLRFLDDGEKTQGLLYLGNKFVAYTLENSQREKAPDTRRISEGVYPVGFNRDHSLITEEYRENQPWFDYHLEIKNTGTEDCFIQDAHASLYGIGSVFIADGVNAYGTSKMISSSGIAFEKFYKAVHALLEAGNELSVQILDEDWFERASLAERKSTGAFV